MNKTRQICATFALTSALVLPSLASADTYKIDTEGAHAFVQFRIQHLGYSWLYGRFNEFDGAFTYDEEAPAKAKVEVAIKTASVDSNHAERDKHLRGADFLDVDKYPEARFVSTSFEPTDGDKAVLVGDLTLHGVTKPVTIDVEKIGSGPDPWGGYRVGFEGTTEIALKDFGIDYDLGPASANVELTLSVEGIRQ
jgi:polyisoprenoid-binding protein YceI